MTPSACRDVLLRGLVRKIGGPGSGYHGPRPGTGRPGQVGGSRSFVGPPDLPAPGNFTTADQQAVEQAAQQVGVSKEQLDHLVNGLETFANEIEERTHENLEWELGTDVYQNTQGEVFYLHTKADSARGHN